MITRPQSSFSQTILLLKRFILEHALSRSITALPRFIASRILWRSRNPVPNRRPLSVCTRGTYEYDMFRSVQECPDG